MEHKWGCSEVGPRMLQFSPPPELGVGQALLSWVPALAWGCVPVRRNVEHSQASETAFTVDPWELCSSPVLQEA